MTMTATRSATQTNTLSQVVHVSRKVQADFSRYWTPTGISAKRTP